MSEDYFTRLGDELAACTRRGTDLGARPPRPPRLARGARRTATTTALVLALAASLVTEFPAAAYGHPHLDAASAAHPQRRA